MQVGGLPLLYVNAAWERLTGYERSEAVGKNCRFLQGESTEEGAIAQMVQSLRDRRSCTVIVSNYKKDGTCFLNRLRIWPLRAFCVARLTEVRLPLLQGFFGELLPKYRVLYDSEAYIEDDCYGCDRMVVETAEAG